MKFPPSLKPGIWGAVIGATAISVVGFSSFGWTLGSTAERMATQRAQTALVGVLAPICVEKFQHQADAATMLQKQRDRYGVNSGDPPERCLVRPGRCNFDVIAAPSGCARASAMSPA